MTANLFGNYDEAMLRRIARHIEFRLPDVAMREALLRLHLPNAERVPENMRGIATAAHGMSVATCSTDAPWADPPGAGQQARPRGPRQRNPQPELTP